VGDFMQIEKYGLRTFNKALPEWVMATDVLEFGQTLTHKKIAVEQAYINPNSKNLIKSLVFDIDRPQGGFAWFEACPILPEPNWTTINPVNQHAHLGYVLADPVSRSLESHQKPQRYLARVQEGLTAGLLADRSYAHTLTKTPAHQKWVTHWGRKQPYELGELREYLPKDLPLYIPKTVATGLGRNVTLFDGLRAWSYRALIKTAPKNFEEWQQIVFRQAELLNSFSCPLPTSEIRATARSVAKWTFKNISVEKFSAIQSNRGKLTGLKTSAARMDRVSRALNIL
jgi:hypothetical protein